MRIFLAGATGVIGVRLIPLMLAEGHVVAAMTRTPEKVDGLRAAGVIPVLCDLFDPKSLNAAVKDFRPDVIAHQVTDLPDEIGKLAKVLAATDRVRSEGTRNLLAAAQAVNASGFVAQSIAWDGGPVIEAHENAVISAGGTVLRYMGAFTGPAPITRTICRPPLGCTSTLPQGAPCRSLQGLVESLLSLMTTPPHDSIHQPCWSKSLPPSRCPRGCQRCHARSATLTPSRQPRGPQRLWSRGASWVGRSGPRAGGRCRTAPRPPHRHPNWRRLLRSPQGNRIRQARSHIRPLANSCKGWSCLSAAKFRRRSPKAYRRGRRRAHTFCRHDLSRRAR